MHFKAYAFLSILLLLSGCRVGPVYTPPDPEVPSEWKATSKVHKQEKEEPQAEADPWWEVFHDPLLNQLEEEALHQSPTLYKAIETLIMAQAEAVAAKSPLYPHVTFEPMASQVQSLTQIFFPPGFSSLLPSSFATQIQEVFRTRLTMYRLPVVFDYEVDLWGKLRSQYDSAFHYAESKAAALRAALLTITSSVAAHYFQMRAYDTELEQIEKIIAINKRSLQINDSRYKQGLSSLLDVAQAREILARAQSDLEEAQRLRNIEENLLATLIGTYASEFSLPHDPLHETPPQIPANLPSMVLLQRPDIAEAERLRASYHDQINVAYASFFPRLSLTSSLGYASPELHRLLTWPARLFSMAAYATQPIFEGYLLSANLRTAIAQFQQADASYCEKVLSVLQEVEDALQNIEQQDRKAVYLKESAEAASLALKLSQELYENGLTNYLQVSVVAQDSLQANISFARNLGARYVNTVQLVQALGGNWDRYQDGVVEDQDYIEAGSNTCLGS